MKKFISVLLTVALVYSLSCMAVSAEGTKEVVAEVDILHTHSGTSGNGGGCYTNRYYSEGCTNTLTYVGVDWNASSAGNWGLYKCPAGHYMTRSVLNAYGLKCNLGAGYYYKVACGLNETTCIGTFKISKSFENSTYMLIPESSCVNTAFSSVSFTWQDGTVGDLVVTANGSYTCTMQYTDNGQVSTAVLSYTVSDYDTEPPVIEYVVADEVRNVVSDIEVSATDNVGVVGYKLDRK